MKNHWKEKWIFDYFIYASAEDDFDLMVVCKIVQLN
jgi:hypothetical protein